MRPQTFCGVMPMTALMGCATNPYTHWLQLELMPRAKNRQWGCKPTVRSFTILKCKSDPQQVNAMQRIAARIIDAAKASKCADIAKKFDWQVSAIKDGHTQNAFALRPKMLSIRASFPWPKTKPVWPLFWDTRSPMPWHGAERMSQGLVAQGAVLVASFGAATQGISRQVMAGGALANYGFILPYSRKHESEADYIGLLLAADAGYD